mmetsp:Transcript_11745/g.33058  ORF Transcript_11745/g.33058 Transcript_11745/m.33058 type:complete len:274 (+) Transcript_11745:8323-9144(+)
MGGRGYGPTGVRSRREAKPDRPGCGYPESWPQRSAGGSDGGCGGRGPAGGARSALGDHGQGPAGDSVCAESASAQRGGQGGGVRRADEPGTGTSRADGARTDGGPAGTRPGGRPERHRGGHDQSGRSVDGHWCRLAGGARAAEPPGGGAGAEDPGHLGVRLPDGAGRGGLPGGRAHAGGEQRPRGSGRHRCARAPARGPADGFRTPVRDGYVLPLPRLCGGRERLLEGAGRGGGRRGHGPPEAVRRGPAVRLRRIAGRSGKRLYAQRGVRGEH